MSSMKKRGGGRHNRGGGKSSRGRGGGGKHGSSSRGGGSRGKGAVGGDSRKGGARAAAYGYDDDAVVFAREEYSSEQSMRYPKKREANKVPMQRLHMSVENQEMVKDMLQTLHGNTPVDSVAGDCEAEEEEDEFSVDNEYEEVSWQTDDQYWMSDRKLVVEDLQPSVSTSSKQGKAQTFSNMALLKLLRYGFDKGRCEKALTMHDGDIGRSLEYLLCKCFDLKLDLPRSQDDDDEEGSPSEDEACEGDATAEGDAALWEDIEEQRVEEMTALASIYEKSFSERLYNKVWVISLELPHLTEMVQKKQIDSMKDTDVRQAMQKRQTKPETQARAPGKKKPGICQFFQKGGCRFGDQCKYKHQVLYNETDPQADGRITAPEAQDVQPEVNLYNLEIRFPDGNRYPYEVPFIAFSSTNPNMASDVCLRISERLAEEARTLADSGLPAVFSLVNVLESEDELASLFAKPPMKFSLPEPILRALDTPAAAKPGKETTLPLAELGTRVRPLAQLLSQADEQREQERLAEDPDEPPTVQGESAYHKQENMRLKYAKKDTGGRRPDPVQIERINRRLKEKFRRTQQQTSYQKMLAIRAKLPAWNEQDKIMGAIHRDQVLVVSGMTGCGKTTQVPQFLLDRSLQERGTNVYNILCTQPRRISAMAVAERVSDERTEKIGGIVGYQIRLESVQSSETRLLFCTTGILLRRLETDHLLEGVSHVIIDEVHERSEESDFLMLVLRDMLPKRRSLKVILMSATMNADLFSHYFGDCPIIDIPGRTFPVDQFFLEDAIQFTRYAIEDRSPYSRPVKRSGTGRQDKRGGAGRPHLGDLQDDEEAASEHGADYPKDSLQDQILTTRQLMARYPDYSKSTIKTLAMMDLDKINNDLIEALIEWIIDGDHQYPRGGAILVFLPGMGEITSLYDQLMSNHRIGGRNQHRVRLIPLHSTLSSEEQNAVFSRPKDGVTKIVLSTNIAETSVTIEDVVYVIDSGRMKEKRFDPSKGMESLELVWVSKANAMQRKGRAGRVAAGVSFHLFTGHHFTFQMPNQPVPEIHRVPLEQLVLRIKILDIFKSQDVKKVMNKLIESPPEVGMVSAIQRLQDLGALDEEKELTPLGYHLAFMPVDVRIGKLMLYGAIFRCLDSAVTIAATLSFKSPFVAPFDKKEEADQKKREFAVGCSDHLTMLKAYNAWLSTGKNNSRQAYMFCRENFLSIKTMQMLASMKRQFVELLSDIGFIKEGLTVRSMERTARGGGDGVLDATGHESNCNSDNMKLVAAILVAALYPNVVQVMTPESKYQLTGEGAIPIKPKAEELKFKTKSVGYVNIHPSSVNFQVRYYESPYLVFHEKIKTSRVYIRDCTMVSVYPLLLFGGGCVKIDLDRGNFVLSADDGWIKFMAASQMVAELVRELRLELNQLMQDKIESPHLDLCSCPRGSRIIPTIVKLITTQ